MRLLKVVVVLGILVIAGLAGYAYFGDMKADPQEMRVPVELDLGNAVPQPAPAATETAPAEAEPAANDAPAPGPDDLD
ncbi:hypothetical protein [Paracoccus sulfuroxidans]|uniref:Uncharacterized protein n=1 Tax=Paracoccus sulfuroxidans TaxID=384678 RepID=A0A562P0T4_9RHOB|nr:hypothetical protein [Paracoccus sulfuroxidans]TWI38088.1 hypothetical protein IQ24_00222 [Paracoccus sulfuroxidans]